MALHLSGGPAMEVAQGLAPPQIQHPRQLVGGNRLAMTKRSDNAIDLGDIGGGREPIAGANPFDHGGPEDAAEHADRVEYGLACRLRRRGRPHRLDKDLGRHRAPIRHRQRHEHPALAPADDQGVPGVPSDSDGPEHRHPRTHMPSLGATQRRVDQSWTAPRTLTPSNPEGVPP